MAESNQELSNKLVDQGASMKPMAMKQQAQDWFVKNQSALSDLMGSIGEARRLYVTFMGAVSRDANLLQCDRTSIFVAMMQCAELRLYPGPLKQCALIAYDNKKKGIKELQMQPQWQGYLDLAYRAGFVKPPTRAIVVWEADEFDYKEGVVTHIHHAPYEGEPRGERRGVYTVLTTRDGDKDIQYYPAARILRYRSMSKAYQFSSSKTFWKDENPDTVDWMWKKTALKQALKLYPMSAELARAIEIDDEVETGETKVPLIDLPLPEKTDGRDDTTSADKNGAVDTSAAT